MDPFAKAAAYQREALDFMLDALDLQDARDDPHRVARRFALEQRAYGLIGAYQRLCRRVAELERALAPDDEELEALAREVDIRAADACEHDDDEPQTSARDRDAAVGPAQPAESRDAQYPPMAAVRAGA